MTDRARPMARPLVPSDAYDEDYYLHRCAGHEEWTASGGAHAAGIYAGCLQRAGVRPGDVVVDIGTGRGELLAVVLEQGASLAVGIEYSRTAVGLAARTIRAHGASDRAHVVMCDARAVPMPDGCADLVMMLDVAEHLAPAELGATLKEVHRLLRRGGRVFVHTMPNRSIYEVTYRLQRASRPRARRHWPRDPRNEFERRMHVNEQTVARLRRSLRTAGFRPSEVKLGEWIYTDFVPDPAARSLYARLARHRLTARFGAANIWGEGTKR